MSFGSEDRAAYLARAPAEPLLGLLKPVGIEPASYHGSATEMARMQIG